MIEVLDSFKFEYTATLELNHFTRTLISDETV